MKRLHLIGEQFFCRFQGRPVQVAPGVHLRVNWPGDRPFTGQVCVAGKDHEILYPGELYFRVEGRADQALHQLLVGYEVELV